MPLGKYRWILSSLSSKESAFGRGVEVVARFWPQALQKQLPAGFAFPHFGHMGSNLLPQALQNLASSGFSCWQLWHFILDASEMHLFEKEGDVVQKLDFRALTEQQGSVRRMGGTFLEGSPYKALLS